MRHRGDTAAGISRNIDAAIAHVKHTSSEGALEGGRTIMRAAQNNVPREWGKLWLSAYTRFARGTRKVVEVGFTAPYAAYVHELTGETLRGLPRPSGRGTYWGPNGRSKFLERAVQTHSKEFVAILVRRHRNRSFRRAGISVKRAFKRLF